MNGYYDNYSDDDLMNMFDDLSCELSELDSFDDSEEYTRIDNEIEEIEIEMMKRGWKQ